jgi:adenylosuccinate lyase
MVAMNSYTLSPLDGRYWEHTQKLAEYFSEYAYIKYRVNVEVAYIKALCAVLKKPDPKFSWGNKLDFNTVDAAWIKQKENITKHDVKAIEYFVKEHIDLNSKEFVHFGLTSQDVNSVAISCMLMDWVKEEYLPKIQEVTSVLYALGQVHLDTPMLARTHGQPATPTRLGKEFYVYASRLHLQWEKLLNLKLTAKFGGATGGLNAHYVAYPNIDWIEFAKTFVESYGLTRSTWTTQVDHNDGMAELFDILRRINVILLDMCKDLWQYISMDYFKLKSVRTEVGSSAMPHKVNPIDFENAEGNLGIANALLTHFSEKLPISRLQRDLSDSTVMRNFGVPVGHTHIALNSILKGVSKLEVNREALHNELENNWQVVTEAIQTILRREGVEKPYEKLKELSRGKQINKELLQTFVLSLNVSEDVKAELLQVTPHNYIGMV